MNAIIEKGDALEVVAGAPASEHWKRYPRVIPHDKSRKTNMVNMVVVGLGEGVGKRVLAL